MVFHSWLRTLRSALTRRGIRGRHERWRHRPRLEVLEDRLAPAVLLVTSSLDDSSAGTLRAVLATANTDATNGVSDTINFNIPTTDPGYDSTTGGFTITLAQGQLSLSGVGGGKITIDNNNPSAPITISGNNASRIFAVDRSVAAELDNLQLENGWAYGGAGAIGNDGQLTISGCTLSGNIASNGHGGAISNGGDLTISGSTLTGNSATGDGDYEGEGGAIWNLGTLAVNDSTLSGNSADRDGGGISNGDALPSLVNNAQSVMTISNSFLSGNFTRTLPPYFALNQGGGGVYNGHNATLTRVLHLSSRSGDR